MADASKSEPPVANKSHQRAKAPRRPALTSAWAKLASIDQQGHELGVFDRPHAMVDAVGASEPLGHADAVCASGTLSR